ncbi:MAG: SPOR domain-containing protein [Deltaproteobacteria bacterium]|nr:SPOR domain-containing protein [Deltaproteobacteria bacterium]
MVGSPKNIGTSVFRPSLFRVVLWVLIFLVWSSWMFMLGIMAGQGMIPDSLKLKNVVAALQGIKSETKEPPKTEHPEDAELDDPKFGFFDDLTAPASAPDDPPAPNEDKAPAVRYTVQLASLENQENAEAFILRIQKKGVSGASHRVESVNGAWYVVRSGEFDSLAEAESFALDITRRLKFKPLVTKLPE